MRKITDLTTITDQDISMGILAHYVGQGFGASKVGLVITERGQYYIKWASGHESIRENSIDKVIDTSDSIELYKIH